MKYPQRVADITVIARVGSVRGRGGESVRGVIVVNENGITVRIVRPRMSPIERAPDHDDGEDSGEGPLKQTTTPPARPHLNRL